jgi:type IV pilus assembly protein PilM
MLNTKSFLTADFGAGTLKIGEFEPNDAGGLRLKQFGIKSLGPEGAQESTREAALTRGLQELIGSKAFASRNINVCAPGFHVFSKFVKLPPVDTSKVTQIIQYEAQQNVPFPLQEVVWDYQILGTTAGGELEVLLVAIKSDVVDGLFRQADTNGLRIQLVDVSTAALCNAFRFNYGDLEGCTMLLDIGAKTSNLLFFEKGKVYSRSINIGANAITQDFANESKLPFAEAERLKIEEGFVSLGGAYEEPDNPHQAAISKIARQVMTRLHIQVNQTIQFYRGQQGGSAPQRLFLSGGAAVMPYTSQFFAEKLNIPVDYFNPFKNIDLDPGLNIEELQKVAHSYGEVVGLALRNIAHCPVELNLMPKSSIQRQAFSQKKPYFIATIFSLVLGAFALAWFYNRVAAIKRDKLNELSGKVQPLTQKEAEFKTVESEVQNLKKHADQLSTLAEQKFFWAELLTSLNRIVAQTETKARTAQKAEVGLWVESFTPTLPAGADPSAPPAGGSSSSGASAPSSSGGMDQRMRQRYGLAAAPPSEPAADAAPVAAVGKTSTTDITSVSLVCRGVTVSKSPTSRDDLVYDFRNDLVASGLFATNGVTVGTPTEDPSGIGFTFPVTLQLKKTFKFVSQ